MEGDLEPKDETEGENTEGVDLMRATVREQWRFSPKRDEVRSSCG